MVDDTSSVVATATLPDAAAILQAARQTLSIEIEALQALHTTLDATFVAVVRHLYASKGRLVVTGIGKSAIVGQKIVATLNSTGTPALFMHAADAIHGDLGMIQPADTVLCISKSGATPEIKVLVPIVKNLGNRLISFSASAGSYLAQHADFSLLTPIVQEADPNNLAPTASTVAQMALGDAIAVALLSLRGFSPQDFAQYHPGGALGKQLYLRVRDVISTALAPPAVSPDTPVQEVIVEITAKRLGAAAVITLQRHVMGIITDGDLRRMLQRAEPLSDLTAQAIMHATPKTIVATALAMEALQLMRANNISQLIVLDEEATYVGMVHLHDLLKEGLV